MTKTALIAELKRLLPFETGDDPYRNGQADAVWRAIDLVEKTLSDDGEAL